MSEVDTITDEDIRDVMVRHNVSMDIQLKVLNTCIDTRDRETDEVSTKLLRMPVPLPTGQVLLLSFYGGGLEDKRSDRADDPGFAPQWEAVDGPFTPDEMSAHIKADNARREAEAAAKAKERDDEA